LRVIRPVWSRHRSMAQTLGHFTRVVITFPRHLLFQLVDSALLGDEQTLVVLEHLKQPRVMLQKLCSQLAPFAWSPPALGQVVKIEVEHQSAALSFHDAAHLDHLGTHSTQMPLLLLL